MYKDHFPQACPSSIKEGQSCWRVFIDMDVDNPSKIKTSVELIEVGVKTIRMKKNAAEGSEKTVFLVDKIPGITFIKIRPSDKKPSVWNTSISSFYKHDVEIGKTFPVGIRTTKSAAFRTATKKFEQSMQEYTDTIAKLENDYVKNETEIAEYKNELAAYQTILQTLKRMAKRHLKQ